MQSLVTKSVQALSTQGGGTPELDDVMQYLTFMLGSEVFAINILSIKEIIEYGHITEVPKMPHFIRGVINLRGAVVPVIDLSARFNQGNSKVTRKTCVVIVEVAMDDEVHIVGVMVDAVNAVLDIESDQIEPPPTFGARIRNDYIYGMGKIDDRFMIILDVNKVLSMQEMAEIVTGGLEGSDH